MAHANKLENQNKHRFSKNDSKRWHLDTLNAPLEDFQFLAYNRKNLKYPNLHDGVTASRGYRAYYHRNCDGDLVVAVFAENAGI